MSSREQIQRDLREALSVSGCSENALFQLWNILRPQEHFARTTFKRKVSQELTWEAIKEVQILHGGEKDKIWVCNIRTLLQTFTAEVPALANLFYSLQKKMGTKPSQLVLYSDETTGGNIVAAGSRLKTNLMYFYFTYAQLGRVLGELIWFPLCMIQTSQVDDAETPWTYVWETILGAVREMSLESGIVMYQGANKEPFLFLSEPHFFLGDFAVLANILGHLGSTALKPCPFCRNVCKRGCELDIYDPTNQMVDILCHQPELFEPISDQDLIEIRRLLREAADVSKARVQAMQKASGYRAGEQTSLLLSEALLDSMHILWHQGMMAWEVNRLVQRVFEKTAITLKDLQESVQDPWSRGCHSPQGNAYFRKTLLHAERLTGDCYSGCASDLRDLVPLLFFCTQYNLAPSGFVAA